MLLPMVNKGEVIEADENPVGTWYFIRAFTLARPKDPPIPLECCLGFVANLVNEPWLNWETLDLAE